MILLWKTVSFSSAKRSRRDAFIDLHDDISADLVAAEVGATAVKLRLLKQSLFTSTHTRGKSAWRNIVVSLDKWQDHCQSSILRTKKSNRQCIHGRSYFENSISHIAPFHSDYAFSSVAVSHVVVHFFRAPQ